MKITAYVQLSQRQIRLNNTAKKFEADLSDVRFHPVKWMNSPNMEWYEVTAEVPTGTIFEVLAERDRSEGRGARDTVGYFRTFDVAYEAAKGLGVQGDPGQIYALVQHNNIADTLKDWKENPAAVGAGPRVMRKKLEDLFQLSENEQEHAGGSSAAYLEFLRLKSIFEPG